MSLQTQIHSLVIRIADEFKAVYRITYAVPFSDANYCWLAFARSSSNNGTARTALARSTSDAKTASYVEVVCATGNTSLADTTELNLVIYR